MKSSKTRKRASILVLALLLIAVLATPVLAFDSRGGENVVIAADEVVEDDLYVMDPRTIQEDEIATIETAFENLIKKA